jgi:anaphase-promoting complex subunit 6
MQHLALNNMSLAQEYLCAAYSMSTGTAAGTVPSIPSMPSSELSPLGGDPLVLNELGVVLYHQNHLEAAVDLFRQSLVLATSLQCEPGAWVATRSNLGHALRRLGRYPEALDEFDECLRIGSGGASLGYSPFLGGSGGNASGVVSSGVSGYEERGLIGSLYTARGLVLLELNRTMEAVTALHEAVRVLGASGGGDAAGGAGVAGTLLSRALEIWALETNETEAVLSEDGNRATVRNSTRSSRDKGKSKVSRRRIAADDSYTEEWTDEVAQGGIQSEADGFPGSTTDTVEETIEMELDQDAERLLRDSVDRVRGGQRRQRHPAASSPETEIHARARARGRANPRA